MIFQTHIDHHIPNKIFEQRCSNYFVADELKINLYGILFPIIPYLLQDLLTFV